MFDQKEVKNLKYPEGLLINSEKDKPRKRMFQRFQAGPAAVHKVRTQEIVENSRETIHSP
jgi:hypothetical protein